MKASAKIISIGNSRGLRLPKRILNELNLTEDIELETREGELIVRPAHDLHAHWEESAKALHEHGDDVVVEAASASQWDVTQWKW